MTNREFNKWLEGFLEACDVNDVSELSGEKLSVVVQKFKSVKEKEGYGYYTVSPTYYKLSDLFKGARF